MPFGLPLGVFIALQVAGIAFFTSLAVTGFARLGGLGDVPDARSSHARTTPTAGGLGVLAGLGAGLWVAAVFHDATLFSGPGSAAKLSAVLACAFGLGVVGLLDDRGLLGTGVKFALILLAGLYAATSVGSVTMLPFGADHIYLLWWSALIGSVLWLFVITNVVNFMDGINGLMGAGMAVASGALCALALRANAPVTALLSGTLAAALLGFLPYNARRRAAVFCGDTASLPVGFLYGCAVLLLVHEQPELRLLYAGPLLVMPFLADVLLTLVLKPVRGLGFTAPHRTHIYQRAARHFGGHLRVAAVYAGLVGLMSLLVSHAVERGTLGSMFGLAMMAGLYACAYAAAHIHLPE